MIKAILKERYVFGTKSINHAGVKETILETRYFSSDRKLHEWLDSFKDRLWEHDKSKVDLVEGVYVQIENVEVDDIDAPKVLNKYATFKEGVSQFYAA